MNWYHKVTQNLANLPDFIAHYESELNQAKYATHIKGLIQKSISELPGITERVFSQLQEIESVLNFMNIQLKKLRSQTFQKYLENYNRALTSRDAERYVDGEQDVIDMETLCNEIALLRNKYLSVMKGLESKNYMLGHLVKLKTAGMEDFEI
jgi:hypothetical protein